MDRPLTFMKTTFPKHDHHQLRRILRLQLQHSDYNPPINSMKRKSLSNTFTRKFDHRPLNTSEIRVCVMYYRE
jgi:hypothetical protein